MTFQAIGYLWAALLASGVIVALHFLARRRPRAVAFPTARFVPDRAVRAPALHRRPSDRVLLALRVSALLLLGLAFARPGWQGAREPVAQITIGDSLPTFSAAFAAALRASASPRADSIDLTIAMPVTRDRWDAATSLWRAQWPGRVRVVHAEARRRGGTAEVIWPNESESGELRGVVIGDIATVGVFGRLELPAGTPVAFWHDGTPAAVEVAVNDACVRHVGFVPMGDVALRPSYRRLAERLQRPCGEVLADSMPLDSVQIALLEGWGGPAAVTDLPPAFPPSRPPVILILLGALALGVEQLMRRRLA